MKTVTLDTFYKFDDFELSQYQILDCIKKFSSELYQYKLFPGLEEFSELVLQFENMNREEICSKESADYKYMAENFLDDLNTSKRDNEEYIDKVITLIEWAKPLIQELVDEGKVIYDYIENNINITEISNIKGKKDKGYLLVPDNKKSIVHLLQYFITRTDKPFSKKIIQTKLLKSFSQELLITSSTTLFREIKGENIDLNEANVFFCHTDLEFPFSETLLPIVQKKLLAMLLE